MSKTVLDFIEAKEFTTDPNALSCQDIMKARGINRSTANHIVVELMERGVIRRVYKRIDNRVVPAYLPVEPKKKRKK